MEIASPRKGPTILSAILVYLYLQHWDSSSLVTSIIIFLTPSPLDMNSKPNLLKVSACTWLMILKMTSLENDYVGMLCLILVSFLDLFGFQLRLLCLDLGLPMFWYLCYWWEVSNWNVQIHRTNSTFVNLN